MTYHYLAAIGLLGMVMASGCAGSGERMDLTLTMKGGPKEKIATASPALIAIHPFADDRTDRSHLGTRIHLWGGESHFNLPKSTLGEATAQAFAEYLRQKGWQADVATDASLKGADIIIDGNLVDVSVDAKSSIGQTTLTAKNRIVLQVKNLTDGSQVRETLTSTGNNQVFWFSPEDAEVLLNDLYRKN
ncbi:MAG: hypothetical protein OEV08_01140, partial [Nitrospira sp.]|nr:hypothetical protein [Nitrospira sp.]